MVEVLPRKFPSPEYVAVIVLVAPAGRLGTVRVAVPFTMVTGVPSCVPLLKNVTVPVGVTGIPESVAKALADRVTGCTGVADVGFALTLTTELCLLIVRAKVAAAVALLASVTVTV